MITARTGNIEDARCPAAVSRKAERRLKKYSNAVKDYLRKMA